MASNKNQHFVPQCYLKNFATDKSKAAICLYNLDRKKLIKNAPIKNQCSKNYFYGEDLVLEKALQPIEGQFSEMIRTIEKPGYILTEEDKVFFKEFWLLQYIRTEEFSKSIAKSTEKDVETLFSIDIKMNIKEVVRKSMYLLEKNRHLVDDLKFCILENNTKTDFITSDNPAILTNRWHFLNKEAQFRSFGLQSAGSLFILPLSPKLLMLAYDGDVYSISNTKGWVQIKNKFDVNAFNYFQFLNCEANIYVRSPDTLHYLECLYTEIKYLRPLQVYKTEFLALDNTKDKIETYVPIEFSEIKESQKVLKTSQFVYVAPPIWSRLIRWKHRGFVMTNGSAHGFVRKARVNEFGETGFYKVPIRKS